MRRTRGSLKAHSWFNELPDDLVVLIAEALLADAQFGIVASVCFRLTQARFARLFDRRLASTKTQWEAAFRASYRWTIENFTSITEERTVSGTFQTPFGHEFRLLMFPRGNGIDSHVSVYLEVGNADGLPDGWKRRAQFTFRAVNHSQEVNERSTPCEFSDDVVDWGFREFIPLDNIFDYLRNDVLEIDIYVSVSTPSSIQRNLETLWARQRLLLEIHEKKKRAIKLVAPRATRDVQCAILMGRQKISCRHCMQPLTTFKSAAAIRTRGSSQYVTCSRGCPPVHVLEVHERLRHMHNISLISRMSWPYTKNCSAPEWLAGKAIQESRARVDSVLAPRSEARRERHSKVIRSQ